MPVQTPAVYRTDRTYPHRDRHRDRCDLWYRRTDRLDLGVLKL